VTEESGYWLDGSWEMPDARRDLRKRIEEVRTALEEVDDPEEASHLALLLRTLEDEERGLGSAEG
jgi:hypothetical protein